MITGFPWASRSKCIPDKSGLELGGIRDNWKRQQKNYNNLCIYCMQRLNLKKRDPHNNPDPRSIAFHDLKERINELRQQGQEIIVMMDANNTLQNTRSALTKWTAETKLIDPLVQRHGTEGEPPTYARGSKRIDYILVSENLSEYVISCGILPLHNICFSDHRALYIDIDLQAFLKSEPPSHMNRVQRGISSEDPRSVKKYQERLTKAINGANFESLFKEVDDMICLTGATDTVHEMIELIDKKFTQIRLDCEKESQSKFRHPWSPALRDAALALNYWNVWLSQKKQNKNLKHARLRYVTRQTEEYETSDNHSLEFIKFKLSQSQRKLHMVQERAAELRQTFLEDKARIYSEEGNQGLESIIRRIIHHERQQQIFLKLKWIRGKTLSGGIDYIIQPDDSGQEQIIRDPETIFSSIIDYNISHFSQADATEITKEPIKSILGPFGTTKECDEILEGQFQIEELECSDAAKAILRQLKRSSNRK
jgi:hypothetical protein